MPIAGGLMGLLGRVAKTTVGSHALIGAAAGAMYGAGSEDTSIFKGALVGGMIGAGVGAARWGLSNYVRPADKLVNPISSLLEDYVKSPMAAGPIARGPISIPRVVNNTGMIATKRGMSGVERIRRASRGASQFDLETFSSGPHFSGGSINLMNASAIRAERVLRANKFSTAMNQFSSGVKDYSRQASAAIRYGKIIHQRNMARGMVNSAMRSSVGSGFGTRMKGLVKGIRGWGL